MKTTSIQVSSEQKQFTINLPANPTTGYQWTIKSYDKAYLNFVSSRYVSERSKLIGRGGNMIFIFDVNRMNNLPEKTTILFEYAQPWEPKSKKLTQITVHFVKSNN